MKTLTEAEKELIKAILSDKLCEDLEDIKEDSLLENDLGADSLDQIEIIMELEQEFNIQIPADETEVIETVAHLFECVEQHLKSCLWILQIYLIN